MTDTMTSEEVISMLAEIFEEPKANIKPETHRRDINGWDSLGVLSLMAEYDSRFGITLTTETLDSLETVGDLIDLLKEHGALRD